MDEEPKMPFTLAKVPFEPGDLVALAMAILALGALVVAVIATKAAPGKTTPAATR